MKELSVRKKDLLLITINYIISIIKKIKNKIISIIVIILATRMIILFLRIYQDYIFLASSRYIFVTNFGSIFVTINRDD